MVFVNTDKFACESCIKGHRSSSCHHTDRPLFEVRRKGRPVSQCEKCRELRQSRRVHSRCTCHHNKEIAAEKMRALTPASKTMRFIPILPALPNGLKDLQTSQASNMAPSDLRQRVGTLLNPCNCKSIWKCRCRVSNVSPVCPEAETSLATLARAAAMCGRERSSSSVTLITNASSSDISPSPIISKSKRISRPGSPNHISGKRHKCRGVNTRFDTSPGPDLPPILFPSSPSETRSLALPVMPPITISSLVGSGCTCGLQCACPGCIQHRGREHASKDRRDCADGCGSCINHAGGIELPSLSSGTNPPSILDQFFARAAALPRPPTSRKIGAGIHIDPMNVMVYPTTALETEEHGIAFGLVSLPKLECCGGVCGCPEGRCGCGKACDGSCAHHNAVERVGASSSGGKGHSSSSALPSEFLISPSPAPVRACCAE